MGTLPLPTGFVEKHIGNTLWWIREGWKERLLSLIPALLHSSQQHSALADSHSAFRIRAGRGTIQRIQVTPQEAIIVRPYRRGGFVRHFLRDLYWDRPLRPFAELTCTEEAQRRGVPTVEVLGAYIEWTMGILYRGWLVTREATGFHTLWDWLQTEESSDLRQQILTGVAQAVAIMHKAGIAHADFNPTNVLVDPASDSPQVLLIDFDRARMFPQLVPAALREANLRRFRRFFGKHDAHEERLSSAEFAHFAQGYHAACR